MSILRTLQPDRRPLRPALTAMSALIVCLSAVPVVLAGQMDITTFNTIRLGMAESEVLVRAGPPDLAQGIGTDTFEDKSGAIGDGNRVIAIRSRTSEVYVKQLNYIPGAHAHDPHLTVITITGGYVSGIDRTKIFTRSTHYGSQRASSREYLSDHDLKIRRADRTLQAAEKYAETRARLKEQARIEAADTNGVTSPIYRATDTDGNVYFGDKPPQ